MGLISERYHRATKSILSKSFLRFIFCTEMKNKPQHKETLRMTTNTWLTPTEAWSAKIYSNGWKKPGLGTADVTEKATGGPPTARHIAPHGRIAPSRRSTEETHKKTPKLANPG